MHTRQEKNDFESDQDLCYSDGTANINYQKSFVTTLIIYFCLVGVKEIAFGNQAVFEWSFCCYQMLFSITYRQEGKPLFSREF